MKSVLTIIFFVLSTSVFATSPKGLVGEGVSGYAQCMKDTVDCTSGCEKRCAEIYSSDNSDSSRRNEPVKARKKSGQSTTVKQQ